MRVTVGHAVVLAGALAVAPACSKFQARTPGPIMALDVPPPPARVAVPVQLPEPEPPLPPVVAVPAAPPARGRGEGPATGTRGSNERTPATAPAATPAPDPSPGPVLQTTREPAVVEQRIQVYLQAAQRDLDRVNRSSLGAQARAQYDSAAGFIRNAVRAVEVKNYLYAEQLAVKAAAVARELGK